MIGRDEALDALRHELVGRELVCVSPSSVTVLDVADIGSLGFLLQVRAWRSIHQRSVLLAADDASRSFDRSLEQPLADDEGAEDWARSVAAWLEVQVGTGALRWAPRVKLEDGRGAVDLRQEPEAGAPRPWYVGYVALDRCVTGTEERRADRVGRRWRRGRHEVSIVANDTPREPDPEAGAHLAAAGFDVGAGRSAAADGTLISWLQLVDDDRRGVVLGQLVAAWRDEAAGVAGLMHLEHRPRVPVEALEHLVLTALHDATDAGARLVEHRLDEVVRVAPALRWQVGPDVTRLDTAAVP